jgi:Ala-tRNA(Pro) deacylase
MAISKKITGFLDKNKYKYQIIEHRTTYTAWDVAQTEHVKPQEIAKALVLKLDGNYAVALVPANKNLDKQKFLKVYNAIQKKNDLKSAKKVEFAKEVWMKKSLPGKVGATPPFSGLLKIAIFADKGLMKNKKVYLNSGEYEFSFLISVSEYLKKEKPVLGVFGAKKK